MPLLLKCLANPLVGGDGSIGHGVACCAVLHGFVLGRNDGAQVDQVADLFCRDACRHSLPKRSFTPTVVAGAAVLSDGAVSVEEM